MKEGWKRKPLGSILSILNGFAFDAKAFSSETGMPLIRIRDLKNGVATQTNFDGPFDQRYVVKAGSFLIGMDGEFGCFEWRGSDALLNQRVCKLHSFAADIDPRFLFYGINKHLKEIEDNTTFTTVKHLSSKQIANIEFAFPPLDEQRRIVAVLDKAFAGIATATANAQKNLTNARALFESTLSEIFDQQGSAWPEFRLSEVGKTITGNTPKTGDKTNFGDFLPFIKPGNFLPDGSIAYDGDGLSEKGVQSSRLIPAGSALMVCIGATIGKSGYTEREVTANQQINAVIPRNGVVGKFLYYQFLTPTFQRSVRDGSGQATLPIISKSKWSDLLVRLPDSPQEQTKAVSTLDEISEKSQQLLDVGRRKLAALTELKQSLLLKAFAGELT